MNLIKVEKGTRYISEIMDDLPHNSFIDKGITDCGGTTLAITNKENYIIAVHSIALLKNKCEQHKNVLGVYGDTLDEHIDEYIKSNGNKIIVTYDSLPRLINRMDVSNFRLLVDEVQVLIRYVGQFKSKVCNDLINNTYNFKSVSYMTATPPPRKYLPEPMRKLEYYKFSWKNAIKPNIKHKYVGRNITTKTVSYILDKWTNTNNDIFVFYNSRSGVTKTINKLIQAEPEINISNINLFFSNNDNNSEYFKKYISNDINISIPLRTNTKRINFVSSFGFEGVDFYNQSVSILVVSDPKYKSMRYDISIDIPQIIGRFRLCKHCDIDFIWSTYTDEVKLSEVDFINKFKKEHEDIKKALTGDNAKNKQIMKAFYTHIKNNPSPHCYIEREDTDKPYIALNKYAFESLMSSYYAMHNDYYIHSENNDKVCNAFVRGKDIFNVMDNLEIPTLNIKHSANLNKTCNFKDLCIKYVKLIELNSDDISIQNDISNILAHNEELNKYHRILSVKDFKKCLYIKTRLEKRYDEIVSIEKIKHIDFNLEINKTYSLEYIKRELQRLYNLYEIDCQVQSTSIKRWFEVKTTTKYIKEKNKFVSALKIVAATNNKEK